MLIIKNWVRLRCLMMLFQISTNARRIKTRVQGQKTASTWTADSAAFVEDDAALRTKDLHIVRNTPINHRFPTLGVGGITMIMSSICIPVPVQPSRQPDSGSNVITVGSQYGQRGPWSPRPTYTRTGSGDILTSCPWGYKLTPEKRCYGEF